MKKSVTALDTIIILIILAVSLLLFAVRPKNAGTTATVYVDGEIYRTLELTEKSRTELTVSGVTVVCENGGVCIEKSTCHNKFCVNAGRLTKAGQCAACVPNKVSVAINGKDENSPWAVTG